MIIVMTMNVGYYFAVLSGIFFGELFFGRLITSGHVRSATGTNIGSTTGTQWDVDEIWGGQNTFWRENIILESLSDVIEFELNESEICTISGNHFINSTFQSFLRTYSMHQLKINPLINCSTSSWNKFSSSFSSPSFNQWIRVITLNKNSRSPYINTWILLNSSKIIDYCTVYMKTFQEEPLKKYKHLDI